MRALSGEWMWFCGEGVGRMAELGVLSLSLSHTHTQSLPPPQLVIGQMGGRGREREIVEVEAGDSAGSPTGFMLGRCFVLAL